MATPTGYPRREAELVEAVVQVGSRVTAYVRAGRGRTVLLISEGGRRSPDPLLVVLARAFRVIAATVPEGEEDPSSWLRGLLEGLGLERPHLVVRGRGGWVDEVRRELADEVDRVAVLLDDGIPPPDEVAGLLARDH